MVHLYIQSTDNMFLFDTHVIIVSYQQYEHRTT